MEFYGKLKKFMGFPNNTATKQNETSSVRIFAWFGGTAFDLLTKFHGFGARLR